MSERPDESREWGLTFRMRLLLWMCAVVLLTGAVIIVVSDRGNRAATEDLADSLFRQVTQRAAVQTSSFVHSAAPVARSLGSLADDQTLALDDTQRLGPQLLAFLKGNTALTCVLYGDESGRYVSATRMPNGSLQVTQSHVAEGKTHQSIYAVDENGMLNLESEDDTSGYDPRARPYYVLAKEKGTLAYTAPYMFFTQGVTGISCVQPVYLPTGELRGVFSVEFDLNALSRFVTALSVSRNSRIFLFTPDQTVLAHPNLRNLIGKGVRGKGELLTLAETDDTVVDAFRQHLKEEYLTTTRPGAEEEADEGVMVTAPFHFFEFEHGETPYMASTQVFRIGGDQTWVVGAIAPQADFLAPVWRTRTHSLLAAGAALVVAALLAAMMARRISQPVQALIVFMKKVGAGDLDAQADLRGGREFRELSKALNQMIADLRERLHLRNSLRIAMDVQQSLLPATDPVSPLLDIAGRSNYCDQTGGDYYDFIDVRALSPNSLLIAVADVMGHGLPSALVMATARAALRTCAQNEQCLAQIMTRTNQVLSADNRHKRFVTLSLLLVDAQTRKVRWASAGHDPAIVFNPASGAFTELEGGDIPLGLMEGTQYEEYISTPLPENAVMVIGTDGIWEMFNEDKKQYGKSRLQEVIRRHHNLEAAKIASALEGDLKAFRGNATPADDVTFVIIKFVGVG